MTKVAFQFSEESEVYLINSANIIGWGKNKDKFCLYVPYKN